MINVAITDDHPIVLDGLKNQITAQKNMALKGVFTCAADTLQALPKEQIDVLLLDINLPDQNGLDLCKRLKTLYPNLAVILLSVHSEKAIIGSSLQNKADGYLLKNAGSDEIITAINQVMAGKTYLCRQSTQIYHHPDEGLGTVPVITRREKEVLHLIAQGYTTQQIADQLYVSAYTVESHRKNLMEKFEANNMPAIVKLATLYKLI